MIKSIPLITPIDKYNNIDYFSLEKLIFYINNLNYINYITIFDKFSEYNSLSSNEKIDIINCLLNNNKNKKIILYIKNIYNFLDLKEIINQKIYKDIYYFIIDYPNLPKKYKKNIFENFNNLFKYFKFLFFFINIKKKKINENLFFKLKKNNNNFLGIIYNGNYFFLKYNLIKKIEIIINNDLYFLNQNNIKTNVISPLFLFFNDFLNNLNFYNLKKVIYLKKFIYILYNKINYISGIKYILKENKICKHYMRKPCNNINKYKKLFLLYKNININEKI
ncbi:MAG: hypothetical protein NHG13_00175 [Candidatus Shikimatogenerans bostrichidophilus]|nr:MAG: hypothetical protein NHG13_00175 [Candidatus Shikimatogenerans bostrichidophilus]